MAELRRFVRSLALTVVNEARLLGRDPVSLAMLVIAPVVIMTVAGYSLGALYGAHRRAAVVPLVDRDGGGVAEELLRAVPPHGRLRLEPADDLAAVRRRLQQDGTAPLAIEVPPGTSETLAAGRSAALVLYVDPARRLEVNALEVALGAVERRVAAAGRTKAQHALAAHARELRHALAQLERALARARRAAATAAATDVHRALADARAQLTAALARSRHDVDAAAQRAQDGAALLRSELAERQAALGRVAANLAELDRARSAFEGWLAALRAAAGPHASEIPPPPAFPHPPAEADLALLTRPLDLPPTGSLAPPALDTALVGPTLNAVARRVADVAHAGDASAATADPRAVSGAASTLAALRARLDAAAPPTLPGTLDAIEQAAVDGVSIQVNAFDQYVPGFGVTFLLIGMMLGISLTLFDERDWGTLERVRAGGASLAGILVGKVLARACVGVVQMLVLFGVGWAVFDVTLGRTPAALLLPMVSMAFAGAALGLVIPSLAPAHDSVMPLGTMTSLALAAIGGCWWPLDFEPAWMRSIAHWLPTTWTMQAYNDLMIRGAPASAALVPFMVTTAIGCVVLAVGVGAALVVPSARRT